MKEKDFYKPIADALESSLQSEFKSKSIKSFWRIGKFSKGMKEMSKVLESKELSELSDMCELDLDVFFVFKNESNGKVCTLIVEVKYVDSMGLNELSQLIGYMLVSNSDLGILVNVDGRISSRLHDTLGDRSELTDIVRFEGKNEKKHKIGVFYFDSATGRFRYTSRGKILNVPELAAEIEKIIG